MTDFNLESDLSFSDSSLKSASKQLESELGSVSIGGETGGTTARRIESQQGSGLGSTATTAVGTKLSGVSGTLDETLDLDQERNTLLSQLLDATERNSGGGGGGGGGVSSLITLGGMASLLGGTSLSSLLGTASLGALVSKTGLGSLISKASFTALLKKTPALATLVTSASLADDLITGTLGPDDLVGSAISVGEIMSFGMLNNKYIEGLIGTVTLSYGAAQIGSLVTGTLSSTALSGYLGGTGLGSLISGGLGTGKLATLLTGSTALSIGSILAPLAAGALAGYLGAVALDKLIDTEGATEYDPDTSKTSASTPAAQQGPVDLDGLTPSEDDYNPEEFLPEQESQEDVDDFVQRINSDSGSSDSNESEDTGSSSQSSNDNSSGGGTTQNRARNNTSQSATIDYSPTINADLSNLERKIDNDLRELQREVDKLNQALDGR